MVAGTAGTAGADSRIQSCWCVLVRCAVLGTFGRMVLACSVPLYIRDC